MEYLIADYINRIRTISSPEEIFREIKQSGPDITIPDMNFKAGKQTGHEGLYMLRQIMEYDPFSLIFKLNALVVVICLQGFAECI